MYGALREDLAARLEQVREAGTYKSELVMTSAQGAHVEVDGRRLLNLCGNNYLGLASHPAIVEAAHEALDRWGYGMASVRFICGTQELHRSLEERLSAFLGSEDTILFGSCFDANGGLFEALLDEQDAVISDQLNHASIIDGIRLCKAQRLRYANGDMDELAARLAETADARRRLIATDGVFSMDGYLARLDTICDLAEAHDALVMVDDSHAVGVVGPGGRGSHEHHDVAHADPFPSSPARSGSGRRRKRRLRRRAARDRRAAPPARAPLPLLEQPRSARRRREPPRSRADRELLRAARPPTRKTPPPLPVQRAQAGFELLPGEHPIVPVMVGDELEAARLSRKLVELGVYAVSFSYPVVPRGAARIRTQMSAAHSLADLDFAVERFTAAREALAS